MNKRITIKKIMLMLYALLMCLPLISVGFRSLYVTFNENAYESYYGETINQKEYNQLSNYNELSIGTNYQVNIASGVSYTNVSGINYYYFNDFQDVLGNLNLSFTPTYILMFTDSNNKINIQFKDATNTNQKSSDTNMSFSFQLTNYTLNNQNVATINTFYEVSYNNYSYLDNAFDYSLHEFIDNNNTGLINFVGLFSDMFLGNSNVENGLYLGFANFMMNYALFISCAYFVFEVLMWFINYCRKWLYAFEDKGGAE